MTKYLISFALLGLFACGGAQSDGDPLNGDAPEEQAAETDAPDLGQAEEPLNAQGPFWGVSTASTHNACNKTSLTQVCSVLGHAGTVTYCYGNGVSDSDISTFDFVMGRLNSGQQKFQFSRVFFQGSASQNRANCEAASVANVELKIRGNSTCPGAASGTSITNFACLALGPLTALGEDSTAPPGSWNKHSQGGITLDYPDFDTLGTSLGVTPAQVQCVKMHGLMHSAEAYVGIGGKSTSTNFIASSNALNPKTVSAQLDSTGCNYLQVAPQEQCSANSFSTTNPSIWGWASASCPQ